ncbi:Rieske 2Fe-2S domain-containing protein [Streptomyces sp. KL116D]|uniref:Rieske 2Fe-2S domain-containing protein n=1 Tax=Streptomyces sp. KL116D TaxID=3045152 RepID=UPI00355692D2
MTEGCGTAQHFFCRYHGWRWNLDGSVREVVDPQDWGDRISNDALCGSRSPGSTPGAGSSSSP